MDTKPVTPVQPTTETLPLTAHTGGNLPLTSEETTSVPPAPAPPSVQTFEPNWADKYSVYSWPIMWSSALHKSGNFQQGDNPLHVQYDPEADKILEKRPVRGLGLFSSSLSGWMPFHKNENWNDVTCVIKRMQDGKYTPWSQTKTFTSSQLQSQRPISVGKLSRTHPLHRDENFKNFVGVQGFNPLHVHFNSDQPESMPSVADPRAKEMYEKSYRNWDKYENILYNYRQQDSIGKVQYWSPLFNDDIFKRSQLFGMVNPLHVNFNPEIPAALPSASTRGKQFYEDSYKKWESAGSLPGSLGYGNYWYRDVPQTVQPVKRASPIHNDGAFYSLFALSAGAAAASLINPLHVKYDPDMKKPSLGSPQALYMYQNSLKQYGDSLPLTESKGAGVRGGFAGKVGNVVRSAPIHKDETFSKFGQNVNPLHVHYLPDEGVDPSFTNLKGEDYYKKSMSLFERQGGLAALGAGMAVGATVVGVTTTRGAAEERLSDSRRESIEGMRNIAAGNLPTNRQLDAILEKTIRGLDDEIVSGPLRPHSKKAVVDARALLVDLRQFIHEKNDDEKFQRFFLATKAHAQGVAESGKTVAKDTRPVLISHLQTTIPAIRNLVTTLVLSAEFRTLLTDFIFLLKDASTSIANKNKPETTIETHRPQPGGAPVPVENVMRRAKENVKQFVKGAASDIRHGRVDVDEDLQTDIKNRFREILKILSQHEEYETAVRGIFAIWDEMKGDLDYLGRTVKTVQRDPMWQESVDAGKGIIASFTGEAALDTFLNHAWILAREMRYDPYTRNYFSDARVFLLDIMKNPMLLQDDIGTQRFNDIVSRGRTVVNRWNKDNRFNDVLSEAQQLLSMIVKDPSLTRIGKSGGRLARDVFIDEKGRANVYVTKEIIEETKDIILPVLIEHLKALPIPRIEGHTQKMDYMVDGLMLQGYDIVPEHVEMKVKTGMFLNTKKLERNKYDDASRITLTFHNFSSHVRDVHFFYRKKTFPKIADEGLLDMDMTGPGTSLRVKWVVDSSRGQALQFRVDRVFCHIASLKLHFKQAKHLTMDKLASALFTKEITRRIERMIEDSVRDVLIRQTNTIDNLLAKLHERGPTLLSFTAPSILTGKSGEETVEGGETAQPTQTSYQGAPYVSPSTATAAPSATPVSTTTTTSAKTGYGGFGVTPGGYGGKGQSVPPSTTPAESM